MLKSTESGAGLPWFQTPLLHVLGVWPCLDFLTPNMNYNCNTQDGLKIE